MSQVLEPDTDIKFMDHVVSSVKKLVKDKVRFEKAVRDRVAAAREVLKIIRAGKGYPKIYAVARPGSGEEVVEVQLSFLPSVSTKGASYFVSVSKYRFKCTCTDFNYNSIYFERLLRRLEKSGYAVDIEKSKNVGICKHVIAAAQVAIDSRAIKPDDKAFIETLELALLSLAARYSEDVSPPTDLLKSRKLIY